MLAQVTMSRALVRFSLEATSITDRCSLPEHRNVRLPGVSRLEWTQLKVIIVADLQKMAVAEWLQSFNSIRGPMKKLGIM